MSTAGSEPSQVAAMSATAPTTNREDTRQTAFEDRRNAMPTEVKGLQLRNYEDMWNFAKTVAGSGMAPKCFNHDPGKIMIAIQFGAELGLTPMASLRSVAVVHNQPTLWGDAVLGLCMKSGRFDFKVFREWMTGTPNADDWTAHCAMRRHGGETVERTFSVFEAKRANLWQNKDKPTWSQYPERMLKYRARAFACRDTFPDVLQGLHTGEELTEADRILDQIDVEPSTSVLDRVKAATSGANGQKPQPPAVEPEPEPPAPSEPPAEPKPEAKPAPKPAKKRKAPAKLTKHESLVSQVKMYLAMPDLEAFAWDTLGREGIDRLPLLNNADVQTLERVTEALRNERQKRQAVADDANDHATNLLGE